MERKEAVIWTLPPILASSCLAASVMYPFDVLRALSMASAVSSSGSPSSSSFLNSHGFRGLFRQGLVPDIAMRTTMRGTKFFFFPICHRAFWGKDPSQGTAFTKAIAGAFATLPGAPLILPLEVAKLGLQLDNSRSYNNRSWAVISNIMKSTRIRLSGLNLSKLTLLRKTMKGPFSGYLGTQYRQAAWAAGYFSSLSFFEGLFIRSFELSGLREMGVAQTKTGSINLLSGFFAGVFGAILNCPGDVLRTALQKEAVLMSQAPLSVTSPIPPFSQVTSTTSIFSSRYLTLVTDVIASSGIRGLWFGLTPKMLHLGGSGAAMAIFVPYMKGFFGVKVE